MEDTERPIRKMEEIKNAFKNALHGERAHLGVEKALEGLTAAVAGQEIENSPYTIWQLIQHISFWHEYGMDYLTENKLPAVKTAAEGWVVEKAPADDEELSGAIRKLLTDIEKARDWVDHIETFSAPADYGNPWNVYQMMASHISYHLGEIVLLRRMAGDYPPPSGGYTW